MARNCYGNNKKKHCKSFARILKRIAFNEKQISYKEKGFDHTGKSFAYIHKTNPWEIATAKSYGKELRQIPTANSCGKFLPQIATANNKCMYIQTSANNVIFNTCCNKKKFHVLSFSLR